MLGDSHAVRLPLSFARGVDALASRVQPGIPGVARPEGLGGWLRYTQAPEAVPGNATAVTESTRFAGPSRALRPWRVTRRRRRRGGCPWPERSFRPSLARQRRTRSGRHGRKRLPGRPRPWRELAMRTWSGTRLRIRRRCCGRTNAGRCGIRARASLGWWRRFGSCRSATGVRRTLMQNNSTAGSGAAPKPAAGVFTRGLRAIAASRRFRRRTGR